MINEALHTLTTENLLSNLLSINQSGERNQTWVK